MEYRPGMLAVSLLAINFGSAVHAEEPIANDDWQGFYVGAALGTPRGDDNWHIDGTTLALLPGGWNGSAPILTFGRDWQNDRLVYGASLSVGGGQFLAQPTSAVFFSCVTCQTEVSDLVTLRGRAGMTAGNTLFFASGGFARANATAANVGGAVVVGDDTLTGWSAGLGVEHRIGDGLSLSVAYDRVNLGSLDLSTYTTGAVSDVRFGLMQVGMNFHW